MPIKKEINSEEIAAIIGSANLSNLKISKKTGVSVGVIKRILKENGVGKEYYKIPKIPTGAIKKDWFNFEVYSSGHVRNKNSGKWTNFKVRKTKHNRDGKEYNSTEKKATISINNDIVKKDLTISQKNLIAILFVKNPDPSTHKWVHFKEGGRYNCDYRNLYWSDKHEKSGRVKVLKSILDKHYKIITKKDLHKSDIACYDYYISKDPVILVNFFYEERRYFMKVMIDVWKNLVCKKVNYSIIEDVYLKFTQECASLIDRGFFMPKTKWFIVYCKRHLIGALKNKVFRECPKTKRLNELYMPSALNAPSHQKHDFD